MQGIGRRVLNTANGARNKMKVHQLLNSPEKWVQGAKALSAKRRVVKPRSRLACQWCLSGGIQRCYPNNTAEREVRCRVIAHLLQKARHVTSIALWNDDTQ